MVQKEYSAQNIEVLEGLEAVRLRPGMYIGGTGNKGMHHLLWEIIDNAVDEISNGYGDTVKIELLDNNVMRVADNGRGVPVDKNKKYHLNGVELVYTKLHSGAKFDNDEYTYSGGLHGVGAAVTNALSEWLTVEVKRDGHLYREEFYSPQLGATERSIKSGLVKTPLEVVGKATGTGTTVTFKPDERVFGFETFKYDLIAERMRDIAYLNKDLTVVLEDNRMPLTGGTGKKDTFAYEGGIADYVLYLNEGKKTLYEKPIYVEAKIENEEEKFQLEVAIQHTQEYSESIYSYVNNIPTADGGTHEVGFKSAVTKVFNDYARKNNILKDKQANLLGEDFREGMVAVITVKMQNVQFEGQTKGKLGNPEVRTKVENILSEKLPDVLAQRGFKAIAEAIINKALGAAKTREATKKAKDLSRQKNSVNSLNLVGKLAACSGRNASINELFIVEGDSAGGSAKQARDRMFQAILPLRGKPLNVEKSTIEAILKNEEFATLISALGTGIEPDFDIESLKYDKVIILADADTDGGHIRALLLTFFFRYMRPLVTSGHVYIGMPPLYRLQKKDEIKYCYDDAALVEGQKIMGKGALIQRFKGLGEMDPKQLWETTMDPNTRALTRVTIDDAAMADKRINILMGDDPSLRKDYIYEYANFNKIDDFVKTQKDTKSKKDNKED